MTEDRGQNVSLSDDKSSKQAMNTAVRILTHRDHSTYEMKQKLRRRGFASKVIDAVIVTCARCGYLDDERTAQVYILQLKRKCFGKRYIRLALKRKRLVGETIERILLENYPADDEYKYAGRLLAKKMKRFERETDFHKKSDKIYRFLYARGFNTAVISDLIQNLVKS